MREADKLTAVTDMEALSVKVIKTLVVTKVTICLRGGFFSVRIPGCIRAFGNSPVIMLVKFFIVVPISILTYLV